MNGTGRIGRIMALTVTAALLMVGSPANAAGGSCAPAFIALDAQRFTVDRNGIETWRGGRITFLAPTADILTVADYDTGTVVVLRSLPDGISTDPPRLFDTYNWSFNTLWARLYCVVLPRNTNWGTSTNVRPGEYDETFAYSVEAQDPPPLAELLEILQVTGPKRTVAEADRVNRRLMLASGSV